MRGGEPMLIEKEYHGLYRYCLYRLQNREDAEDAVQETFLRYLQRPDYRGRHEREYLYTIARNLCTDKLRQHQELPLDAAERLPSGQDVALQTELRAALESLSEDDREIALLRFLSGERIGVIAGMYGISRFAMSRRIKDIRNRLKAFLKEEGEV